MGDILSGGKIDESTSGPNPPKADDRKRDILSEQRDRQNSDSIGGAQFPTRAQPPPQIPEAQQIVAPRINAPTYFEPQTQLASVDTREIARQATIDVLKNVTINGQGPSVDGSSISFNIPQSTKTSEITFSQPTPSQQASTSQPPAIQPQQSSSVVEKNQANGGTTSITLEPPKRAEEPSRLQAADFGASKDLDKGQPVRESRLDAADFGSSNDLGRGQPERESRLHAADFGSSNDLDRGQPERESRLHAPDFGASKDLDKGQPTRESRLHSLDFGSSSMDKQSDSSKAYQAAEQRRDEKRESDPDFDRHSRLRQEGETPKEFKERQEELRKEQEMNKRAAAGDLGAALGSGMIPVALTRADGNKKILAYISSTFVGVTENPDGGERITKLPPEDSYYDTGASDNNCGLSLFVKTVNDNIQIWIKEGMVGNQLISEQAIASGGSGLVYANVSFDGDTGNVTEGNVATSEEGDKSIPLGLYAYDGDSATVQNFDCGSVYANVCRNWFAKSSPFFSVALFR